MSIEQIFDNTAWLVMFMILPIPFLLYSIWQKWRKTWLLVHAGAYLFLFLCYGFVQYVLLSNTIDFMYVGLLVRTAVVLVVVSALPVFYSLNAELFSKMDPHEY